MPGYGTIDHEYGIRLATTPPEDDGPVWMVNLMRYKEHAGGLVHDMFCDGTLDGGVNDTAGIGGRKIRVAARWKNGVHKLRPWNTVVAVTRRLDPDNGDMIWLYGLRTNRLRRLTEPPLDHPATRAAAEAAGMLPD